MGLLLTSYLFIGGFLQIFRCIYLEWAFKYFNCIFLHSTITRNGFLTLSTCLLEHYPDTVCHHAVKHTAAILTSCGGKLPWTLVIQGLMFLGSFVGCDWEWGSWHMGILQLTAEIITVIIFYSIFVQSRYSPPGWTRFWVSGRLMENYDEGQL